MSGWLLGTGQMGCGAPASLPGPCRWEAGSWRESERPERLIMDLLEQNDCLGPRLVSDRAGHPATVSVCADVPPSYSHYYSNPSYHTLSQCSPNPPPPNKVSVGGGDALWMSCGHSPVLQKAPAGHVPLPVPPLPCQVPGSQLFASLQAPERPGGALGHDNHATLPADWKHRREPPPGPLDRGRSLGAKASGEGGCVQPRVLLHLSACVCLWKGILGLSSRGGGTLGRGPGA